MLPGKEDPSGRAVARAYANKLYQADLVGLVPPGTPAADSAMMVRRFVENWIKQQVVLHKAEANLPDESKKVQKQLQEYRNSLLTFAYEQELIRQRLDTNVSDEEIQRYYDEHQRNFELRHNIVKAFYARVPTNAPHYDQFRQWIRSGDERNRNRIEEYCHQFASDFHLDDEAWVVFDELLRKVPLKPADKERFLQTNRYVELADSNETCFVLLREYRLKDSLSPLDFERSNIRDLIINKRKLELVRAMEKAAYNQALQNSEFEIYADEDVHP